MKLPKDARKLTRDLFAASLTQGRIDATKVSKIASVLVSEKPRHVLDILKEYHRLVRLELDAHHATIESAEPLSDSELSQILAGLHAKYGADLAHETKVNSALIGGVRVRVGSDVWDGSVRERLNRLQSKF